MAEAKKRLGRGLEALLSVEPREGEGVSEVSVDEIDPNPLQPRRVFDQEGLDELVASIREVGIVQPVILRRAGTRYQIVAGERRWRAARQAGLKAIPAVIRDLSDPETMEIALIENIQRQDLNPIEEARAYHALMTSREMTQEEVALRVGKSRPVVANALRLLNLDSEVQRWVEDGLLTAGHARAIAALESPSLQKDVGRRVIDQGLNVRQAESFVKGISRMSGQDRRPRASAVTAQSAEVTAILEGLQGRLGTRVRMRQSGDRGIVEIEYYGADDLTRLYELIVGPLHGAG